MSVNLPPEWQQVQDLLRRELGAASESLLAEGVAPTALAEYVDERRTVLGAGLTGRTSTDEADPGPAGGSGCAVADHGQNSCDDPIDLGRIVE